jgi:hypothetical protein
MNPTLILLLLLAAVALLVVHLVRSREERPPAGTLRKYLSDNRPYQIYAGLPVSSPNEWIRVESTEGDIAILADGTRAKVDAILSFIVAYPNDEILHVEKQCAPLPRRFVGLTGESLDQDIILPLGQINEGGKLLMVAHGPPERKIEEIPSFYHCTTLTNLSDERLQVLRFCGCTVEGDNVRIRSFYSAEQFNNWYHVRHDGWISPAESVSDPYNYSPIGTLWVYFFKDETGNEFVTGSVFSGKK